MNTKQIGAAAAGLLLVFGAAQAGSEGLQGRPKAGMAAEVPQSIGATGSDVIVLELPIQGRPSDEEIAAMQMLLLQLLMMQQEMGSGEVQMMRPDSTLGVEI